MKLYPKKGGNRFVSCYLAPIGSREARELGFLNEDGSSREMQKAIDYEKRTVTFSVAEQEHKDE